MRIYPRVYVEKQIRKALDDFNSKNQIKANFIGITYEYYYSLTLNGGAFLPKGQAGNYFVRDTIFYCISKVGEFDGCDLCIHYESEHCILISNNVEMERIMTYDDFRNFGLLDI